MPPARQQSDIRLAGLFTSSHLSGQPEAVIDALDASDFKELTEVMDRFLGKSRQSGAR